jgi:hypothetical protein
VVSVTLKKAEEGTTPDVIFLTLKDWPKVKRVRIFCADSNAVAGTISIE